MNRLPTQNLIHVPSNKTRINEYMDEFLNDPYLQGRNTSLTLFFITKIKHRRDGVGKAKLVKTG